MLFGVKRVWRMSLILVLLIGLSPLGVPAAAAATYDANADFSVNNGNPNGAWTYGWASSLADLPAGLNNYPDSGTAPFGNGDFQWWYDQNNSISWTPALWKNFGPDYDDGWNLVIPAGALILHGGGTGATDLSVVEFTAPSAGQYSLGASFIGRQYAINEGLVYILNNGITLFDNGGTYITTVGDTATYSAILNLAVGDKIDFVVGNTSLRADSIELQAVFNTPPVPIPSAVLLLGSGLLSLLGMRRFRKG